MKKIISLIITIQILVADTINITKQVNKEDVRGDLATDEVDVQSIDKQDNKVDDTIETNDNIIDYEFVKYEDSSLLQSLVDRFSLHDETYLLPLYYAIEPLPTPINSKDNRKYSRFESKFQISFKVLGSKDLFYGVGFYFAYTQSAFFQIYSPKLSAPLRDIDFMPELVLYKPLNIKFLSGELYNIRFGYSHTSNGEGTDDVGFKKSRGVDRVFTELMYKVDNFKLALRVWAFSIFSRLEPPDIKQYIGYSNLKLSYDLYDHHFTIRISNLIHNYIKYKGNIGLEYKYDLFDRVALYAQYFYGYGDNLYQYNIKSQHIGLGIAVVR